MFRYIVLRYLPQWFIAIFALIYITGYLVDFFYYSARGVIDPGADILKLKYIHIGINFFILFLIVTTPVFFLLFGRNRMSPIADNPNNLPQITTTTFMTSIIFFFTVYYTVIFTPAEYFYSDTHPYRLWSLFIFLASMLLSFVAFLWWLPLRRTQELERRRPSESEMAEVLKSIRDEERIYYKRFSVCLLIYMLIFNLFIFYGMIPAFISMMIPYGGFFFLFCLIFTLVAYRMDIRLENDSRYLQAFGRVGYTAIFSLGLLVLYYLSVGVYAYTIFPHIPNIKGGANYDSAPVASVYLQHRVTEENAGHEIVGLDMSKTVIIYSTSSSLYVADACDWQRDSRRASIFQINRDEIKNVTINARKRIKEISDCPAAR